MGYRCTFNKGLGFNVKQTLTKMKKLLLGIIISICFSLSYSQTDNFNSYSSGYNLENSATWDLVDGSTTSIKIHKTTKVSDAYSNSWGDNCLMYVGSFNNDQFSQATFMARTENRFMGVSVRCSVVNGGSYYAWVSDSRMSYFVKSVNGKRTYPLAGNSWSVKDTIRLEISGSTINFYRNRKLDVSMNKTGKYTDIEIMSGNPGIAGSSVGIGTTIDNWSGGSIIELPSPDPVSYRKMKINFTVNSYPGGTGWNNFTSYSSGTSLLLIDTAGVSTSVTCYNEDTWDGSTTTGETTGPYPVNVNITDWWASTGTKDIELRGLNNASFYDIEVYASRGNTTEARITKVSIGAASDFITVNNNTSDKAVFNNINSSAGTIRISFSLNSGTYFYVGAIVLKEKKLSGGNTPVPPVTEGDIFKINKMLVPGVNAYGISLTSWQDKYYDSIAALGFKSVRLVSYEAINSSGLAVVKDNIDKALAAGLIPIYCHWGPQWLANNTPENIATFISDWDYISNYFKGYSNTQLVLELVNEPENITVPAWNDLVANCVSKIRANDPDRPIMVSPSYWAQVLGLDGFVLPKDTMLIVSVHYYRPETFVWQGSSKQYANQWVGEKWYPIQPYIDNVTEWFAPAVAFQAANKVPMNVGEFGVTRFADVSDRARFMNYHARYFESLGWSWALWDFYNDYGIRDTGKDRTDPTLSKALLHDPMPAVMSYSAITLYQSNFSTTNNWAGSTGVSVSASGNELVATVSSAGSALTDRYVYRSISLKKGKTYRISYTIRSNPRRGSMAFTIGGPYVWENMTNIETTGTSDVYTWAYSYYDDPGTLFRFNIGGSTGTFYISNFKVEEITIP